MNVRASVGGAEASARSGFVMLAVLFVLLALLVLCAPFLGTARNANETGAQLAEQAQLRLAHDAAGRHGRVRLGASHPALDATLDWDSLEELDAAARFDESFLDAHDPQGVMWDLEASDEAGRIDWNSAGPHVIANALGLATLLTNVAQLEDTELSVSSTSGFAPEGYLWIDGEIVHYGAIEGSRFVQCTRGLGARYDDEGRALAGPLPPGDHALGTPVLDQRAFAIPTWRSAGAGGVEQLFDAPEQILEAEPFLLARAGQTTARFLAEEIDELLELGSVHAGITGGRTWQHATRLVSPVIGGETQRIVVSEPRWLAVGSTVRIRDDRTSELAIVIGVADGGFVLDRVLQHDHGAYEAEVSVLAKRPVNLNTAPPAVLRALFQHLSLRGRNARILPSQANQLAALVVAMRPFHGLEDFLERLVLPAAGLAASAPEGPELAPFLAEPEALALYANGLNANDAQLEFSTMPFSFVSREVYAMELRASVNAESGVQRTAGVRDRVELVTPQRELFFLWSRQADFDEAIRLDCDAPWWMSAPQATSRWDGRTVPPSRLTPHFGTVAGTSLVATIFDPAATVEGEGATLEHVFAATDGDAWCQLWPSRHSEATDAWSGRILHFDHETRDPEGRYLPDETVRLDADDPMVRWTETTPLLKPLSFEAWVKPRTLDGGTILDVGGSDVEVDRLTLVQEEEDLVLRVFDGFGDHRDTTEREVAELRYAIDASTSPGLPVDVWSHVMIDVRGNRPTQMTMLVNGLAHGVRTPGLTRLGAAASQSADVLLVESTEGFPDRGVARVGNELVEYVREGANALRCVHETTGENAGFGGRLARTRFDAAGVPVELEETVVDHPAGTPVEHYGYSLPLRSNLPADGSALRDSLGLWRVARVRAVQGDGIPADGDPIFVTLLQVGNGIEAPATRPPPFDLVLAEGDAPNSGDTSFMETFQKSGGFAVLVQAGPYTVNGVAEADSGARLGGIEVIRYAGWNENRLHVVERATTVAPRMRRWQQGDLVGLDAPISGPEGRAFVLTFDPNVNDDEGAVAGQMDWGCYVIPISLLADSIGAFRGFLDPVAQSSPYAEHAQITHLLDAELTEWVRYDEIVDGELVRSSPSALVLAQAAITSEGEADRPIDDGGGGGGGGGNFRDDGGGGGGGGNDDEDDGGTNAPTASPPPPPPARRPAQQGSSQWVPTLGEAEDDAYPLTRAAREALRFRGVMGTHTHAHPAGTPLLPVFRVQDASAVVVVNDEMQRLAPEYALAKGLPGRGDAVFVSAADPDHVGWPLRVHRAYRPWVTVTGAAWQQAGGEELAQALPGTLTYSEQFDVDTLQTHVALQSPCPEPMAGMSVSTGTAVLTDARLWTRLSKFPSGELPRVVTGVGVGTGFGGGSDAVVPSMLADEVVFGDPHLARGLPGANPAESTQGAQLALLVGMGEAGTSFTAWPFQVETALGFHTSDVLVLDGLPADAGLLRIGEEILAYSGRDPTSGVVDLAVGGRGLLGTRAQPHQRGEPITYLEHFAVGLLAGAVSAGDALLPLADLDGFPTEGTVLIGSELVHYTHVIGTSLAMPRASTEPGAMDGDGVGLFRGRFGTPAQDHAAGEPVILFPFRYWDRWAPRADAPELAYFGLQMHQPGAWWKDYFFEWEPSVAGGARLGVLARADDEQPWDADPERAPGLWLHWKGDDEGEPHALGLQSDRMEWRVFVQYEPGAFDLETGLAHGWKATPRLRHLGVDWVAPSRVLRSVER